MLLPITNTPLDYAWGQPGVISSLLGRPATTAVEAELWLGAHPASPARITDAAPQPQLRGSDLPTAIAAEPSLTGGTGRLPFLFKIIAPGAPLSLQAHPTAEQARAGFERENAAGIPVGASTRNYRDPYPKPELGVVLSESLEILAGLRPESETRGDLHTLAALTDDAAAAEAVDGIVARIDASGLAGTIEWLLSASEANVATAAVSAIVIAHPEKFPVQAKLAALYPGDAGIVVSLLLHHLRLRRGEAIYLPAGNLHAYLSGVGAELMAASDNVLRGGLTPKHIDVPELLAVLDPVSRPAPLLAATALDGGGVEYRPEDPNAGFGLSWIETRANLPLSGPAIALCISGAFEIAGESASTRLARGEAIYASPDEAALRISGEGLLLVAR